MTVEFVTSFVSGIADEPWARRMRSARCVIASLQMRGLAVFFVTGMALSAAVWTYYFQQEHATKAAIAD